MLQYLRSKLFGSSTESSGIDPAQFGDPIAMQTDWTPAKPGGGELRTRRLVRVSDTRVAFRMSIEMWIVGGLLVLGGVGAILWPPFSNNLLTYALCLGLLIAAGYLFHSCSTPIVFDKKKDCFWRGWKPPGKESGETDHQRSITLQQIRALQLISETCTSRDRYGSHRYRSFELNLILNDAGRINVIDHGNEKKFREDVEQLAGFLEVQIWDAT